MTEAELMELVLARLKKRQTRQLNLMCQENFERVKAPAKKVFYDYSQITLIQVPVSLLFELYHFQKTPWVDWILTGISYQVQFTLDLNEQVLPFVPFQMLRAWPLAFHIAGQPVNALTQKTISRKAILALAPQSWLVKINAQQLTAEAQEQIEKRQIKLIERVDETCIWEKS